ncbi:demethylmenaquinone methyltransferase [Furfurilactobacillus curtus]|uniref:Demethylmenaquinone methyltransferase n=1 Tax=Furfurilactobacillus curtus TaxID=1746200 RepID=A0ABQ5JS43_9LACO
MSLASPKRPASVQALFTKLAPRYDRMNNIISLGQHKKWRQRAMAITHILPGDLALDLCCGTGDWTIALANCVGAKGHIVGVDFSGAMVSIARQKIAVQDLTDQATVIVGDALHLPFPNDTFAVVTIGFGLRNLADRAAGLSEILRVLQPGGQLICLESSQPTAPIIRPLWHWYFSRIMPWLGQVFAHAHDEYDYLQRTTAAFPSYQALSDSFETAGFTKVTFQRFTFGAAACHTGFKSIAAPVYSH